MIIEQEENEPRNEPREKMSRPESRSDPIGGSESSSGCETQDWDSLPEFFFFFLKAELYLWVWPTSYNRVKILYTFRESHLQLQTILSHLQIRARNLHVVNPYKCVGPVVCGCLLMSSPVPTMIKNPC